MNAKDKDKLITHRSYLVDNVNIDGLLTHLITRKTINPRTKATIEKAGSIFEQIEALLDVLLRGGPRAYNDFCDSLKENNQDYIVEHIDEEVSKPEVRSAPVEKDDAEYVKVLTLVDNVVVKVPFVEKPQSPNKRCTSMPSMSPSKMKGKDTRYALKHFLSVPENVSLQDLDEIPSKLTKRDSDDIYKSPAKTYSKMQREDTYVLNGYSDEDFTDEIIVKKSSSKFYYRNCLKAYKMDRMPRGQALIININQIDGMKSRKGSDIDTLNLQSLLQQLHYRVSIFDGPKMSAKNIGEKVYEFSQMPEHQFADATVVCFLSHGDDGHIYGSDGQRIALNKLFSYFDNVNCPSLQDKPKIFIIQACRGDRVDPQTTMGDLTPPVDEADGPLPLIRSSSLFAPTQSDMIKCYPTQQGYRAWRNRERGSWFVQAIVKVFMQYACCEDICAMMNRVNDVVSQNVSNCSNETSHGTMQMSEFQSSLRQPHLYFFPGIGSN